MTTLYFDNSQNINIFNDLMACWDKVGDLTIKIYKVYENNFQKTLVISPFLFNTYISIPITLCDDLTNENLPLGIVYLVKLDDYVFEYYDENDVLLYTELIRVV